MPYCIRKAYFCSLNSCSWSFSNMCDFSSLGEMWPTFMRSWCHVRSVLLVSSHAEPNPLCQTLQTTQTQKLLSIRSTACPLSIISITKCFYAFNVFNFPQMCPVNSDDKHGFIHLQLLGTVFLSCPHQSSICPLLSHRELSMLNHSRFSVNTWNPNEIVSCTRSSEV